MDKTYLIFFGKSSDFKYVVFNAQQEIKDFGIVIPNLELESQIFMIESKDTLPILAKYCFNVNKKRYSLLKLYSYAQNTEGKDNMFGVAFLSEDDISITQANIENLQELKAFFSHQALKDGILFKSSDFIKDLYPIWIQFVNQGGFNKIDFIRGSNQSYIQGTKGIYVEKLINAKNEGTTKVYFSEDLEHLRKTSNKWGKNRFPIYEIDKNGKIVEYEEKKSKPDHKPQSPVSQSPTEKSDKTKKTLDIDFHKDMKKLAKLVFATLCMSTACLIIIIAFFFHTHSEMAAWKADKQGSKNTEMGKDTTTDNSNTSGKNDEMEKPATGSQEQASTHASNMAIGTGSGNTNTTTSVTFNSIDIAIQNYFNIVDNVPSGVTFRVVDPKNLKNIVSFLGNQMKVNKIEQAKLTKNTDITVAAFKDNVQLNSQKYKIAKLAEDPKTHTVVQGESLTSIAQEYNTSVDSLKKWNNLKEDDINEGQILNIAH